MVRDGEGEYINIRNQIFKKHRETCYVFIKMNIKCKFCMYERYLRFFLLSSYGQKLSISNFLINLIKLHAYKSPSSTHTKPFSLYLMRFLSFLAFLWYDMPLQYFARIIVKDHWQEYHIKSPSRYLFLFQCCFQCLFPLSILLLCMLDECIICFVQRSCRA